MEVGRARDGHGAPGPTGDGYGGSPGARHGIGCLNNAVGRRVGLRFVEQLPELGQRDDLGGVAAYDGGAMLAHRDEGLLAQLADADAHRVEHPGAPCLVGRAGGDRDRLRVHGHQRTHVHVEGPTHAGKGLGLVG